MSNKEAYYFSHDSNARQDEKILALRMKHGWEGYGLFWALIEKLRDANEYMCVKDYNLIAFDLRTDASKIKSIIEDFGLFDFTEDGKGFYSESLINRMQPKDDAKLQNKVNGIKGNLIRHKHFTKEELSKMSDEQILSISENLSGTSGGDRGAVVSRSQRKEKKGKESKVNESKVKENKKKNSRFSPPTILEVESYFLEKELNESIAKKEAQKFFDFYDSKNWFVGKNKMAKWKSAASGWVNRMEKFNNENGKSNSQTGSNANGKISGRCAILNGDISYTEFTDDC